ESALVVDLAYSGIATAFHHAMHVGDADIFPSTARNPPLDDADSPKKIDGAYADAEDVEAWSLRGWRGRLGANRHLRALRFRKDNNTCYRACYRQKLSTGNRKKIHWARRPMRLYDGAPLLEMCGELAMTIVVSGHFLQTGRVGGAEHMFYNLLRGLWANRVDFKLLCSKTNRLDPAFVRELEKRGTPIITGQSFGKRFLAEQASCFRPRLHSEAILFPNYFTPPAIPGRLGRVVTVIHDFQYRSFPETVPRRRRAWLRLAHGLTFLRAHRVIVPSE